MREEKDGRKIYTELSLWEGLKYLKSMLEWNGGREGGMCLVTCKFELLSIEVGPVALRGKEQLVFKGVEDDADHNGLLDGQGNRDAREGKSVHKIRCAFLLGSGCVIGTW